MRSPDVEGAARKDTSPVGRSVSLGMPTPPPGSARSREHARLMAAQNPDNSIARGRAGGGTSTHRWQDQAACRDTVGDLFFDPESVVDAKQVCARCPVVDRCLDDALSNGLWDGVFGGLDPHERKAFARQAGMPRHGTASGYSTDGCRCGLCREWMAEAQRRSQQRRQEVA